MREPERLGKYRIDGTLGEGGMGVVYLGMDEDLGRAVAIKTIRPSLLKGRAGRELLERFRREAQAEGRLNHPNIVAVYEFQGDNDGVPFFAMEYVEGDGLGEPSLRIPSGYELVTDVALVAHVQQGLHDRREVDLLSVVQLAASRVAGDVDVTEQVAVLAQAPDEAPETLLGAIAIQKTL